MVSVENFKSSYLASLARELFTQRACQILPSLSQLVHDKLSALVDLAGTARETQDRRDAWLSFQALSTVWVNETTKAWQDVQIGSVAIGSKNSFSDGRVKFELVEIESIENKVLASRLALRVLDFSSWELNDLRLRVQSLEGTSKLHKDDIFRPEVLAQHMVEQWTACTLSRDVWMLVQDILVAQMAEQLLDVYHVANEFLVKQGVMAEIDLRPMLKRTAFHGVQSNRSFDIDAVKSSIDTAPHDETQLLSGITPLAKARMRGQGVLGSLKRLVLNQVKGFDDKKSLQISPQLTPSSLASMWATDSGSNSSFSDDVSGQVYGPAQVQKAAGALRQQSSNLKRAASSSAEKATIEIVALMFQSILSEDRTPPTVRIWFSRLQMPVLRVALSEPEFFGSLQHPARQLIDRMGSCVLGFDPGVSGSAIEIEIRRIVHVIEQYPETGSRVFQLVYDEFQTFLLKFLSEQGTAARVVSIAQQVEQKETLVIQHTIEMRNMLNGMPVREEVREFLFKVWAEVLAMACMRNGVQHEETITLKRAAADLVWAASAKPNRMERAKVIKDLPKLLQLLRVGMFMLGMAVTLQEQHIKTLSDTLADAFMSKTDAIPADRIDAMAKRLANLEDYLSDEDVGDLPLDTESLVMMIGIDVSDIEVITDGGSQPTKAMCAWALELQLGAWFALDHDHKVNHLQFAWRSERKQLHLFASTDGRNFLIQARRLAAYLQAGLLVPVEEDALTVRATRDALDKLNSNPERLLA